MSSSGKGYGRKERALLTRNKSTGRILELTCRMECSRRENKLGELGPGFRGGEDGVGQRWSASSGQVLGDLVKGVRNTGPQGSGKSVKCFEKKRAIGEGRVRMKSGDQAEGGGLFRASSGGGG